MIGKRCCFAGHSEIYHNEIQSKIKETAEMLIKNFKVKEFWVGNYGRFDKYAASAIRELKQIYPDIQLILIIPYLTKDLIEYKNIYEKMYDGICMAEIPPRTPKQYHIIKTNEYMVKSSDYLICYINRSWGGAVRTFEFAQRKKNIKIFNIAKQ